MQGEDKELEEFLQIKSGPRSRLMEAILVLLLARPLRTSEIASNLGLQTKYVSSYLSYWRKKGLVYQEGGRWHLSSAGEDLAKEIIESKNDKRFYEYLGIAREIFNEKVKETINNKERKKENNEEKEFLSFIGGQTNKVENKQQKSSLEDCLSELLSKLSDEERDILELLLQKYKQWGTTYIYVDQLQEEYNADIGWLFKVLRSLQTKRIIYLYHDPKLGLRIGFSQSFKSKLSQC
jgi:Mn-dependent DtxR family transcriptional regulator